MVERLSIDLEAGLRPCENCGNLTLGFLGRYYCDPCIEKLSSLREQETIRELNAALLEQSIVKGLYGPGRQAVTFDAMTKTKQNQKAWDIGKDWSGRGRNAYIFGPVGTGKTTLALCMLNDRAHSTSRVCSVGMCLGLDINGISRYEKDGSAKYSWPKVLLIDDIDKADWTVSGLTNLFSVLNAREIENKRTIMTSNVSPENLGPLLVRVAGTGANESMVAAALDRMHARGGPPIIIELTGQSMRGRGLV